MLGELGADGCVGVRAGEDDGVTAAVGVQDARQVGQAVVAIGQGRADRPTADERPTIRGSMTDDRPSSDELRRLVEAIPLKSLASRVRATNARLRTPKVSAI
jgi:hypothetical protein